MAVEFRAPFVAEALYKTVDGDAGKRAAGWTPAPKRFRNSEI